MPEYRKPWRKNLYENQEYPDNYTDKTFLKELRVNVDFKPISLWQSFLGSTFVVQELCTIIIYIVIYVYLYNTWVEPNFILYITGVATIFGFFTYRIYYSRNMSVMLGHDLRTVLIYVILVLLFAPVLHTLTDSISTDTIYTMTSLMMFIHLIFFDYGVPAAIVSNSLSLSAAVFASICLSSRLSSSYQALILMTVSIEFFILFPILRNRIKRYVVTTLFLLLTALCLLWSVSILVAFVFIVTIIFLNIVCPLLFTKYQHYKDNIYGPWDEALVQEVDKQSE